MTTDAFGVKPREHIPGQVVHDYLEKVAEKFDIADKIRYSTRAISAEQNNSSGGWIVKSVSGASESSEGVESTILARKLIVACGLTSEPFLPYFEGQSSFGKPIFHGKDFAQHADTLETSRRVTVLGGGKTGWDAAYAHAVKGVHVDWVIRKSGHGPAWMSPPFVTPLKKWLEKLVMTRALTFFSPCTWYEIFYGTFHCQSQIDEPYHGSRVQ
jgi:cation diffusion facilitator CzcD-associated flavoprotein CzcO